MATVGLAIAEPENDADFIGAPSVTFRGEETDRPPELVETQMYFRWYSSLNPDADENRYSLNAAALTDAAEPYLSPALGVGSHVITFAASDRVGETADEIKAIEHGGVAGGLEGDPPCVIHVFNASIFAPGSGGPAIAHGDLVLKAEAPALWAVSVNEDGEAPFEINADYHAYNRLRYHWRFVPTGAPSGRPTLDYAPPPEDFGFIADPSPAHVTYEPALPAAATGTYRIELIVEDAQDQGLGPDSDSVNVTLTG